jgi:hypothetical protein
VDGNHHEMGHHPVFANFSPMKEGIEETVDSQAQ